MIFKFLEINAYFSVTNRNVLKFQEVVITTSPVKTKILQSIVLIDTSFNWEIINGHYEEVF